MNEEIWCPECNAQCQNISPNIGGCPTCGCRWTVCPDCGETVDISEEWNYELGVCETCADSSGDIEILTFDKPEDMFKRIEEIFGKDERS